jgi:hypothetical protein
VGRARSPSETTSSTRETMSSRRRRLPGSQEDADGLEKKPTETEHVRDLSSLMVPGTWELPGIVNFRNLSQTLCLCELPACECYQH